MNNQNPVTPGAESIVNLPIWDQVPVTSISAPAPQPGAGAAHLLGEINRDVSPPASPSAAAAHRGAVSDTEANLRSLVPVFRKQVSDRLVADTNNDTPRDQQEAVGRRLIKEVVQDFTNSRVREGQPAWPTEYVERMHQAVFDSLFRLGRIQPLIELPDVENIMIFGHDRVFLDYGNDRIVEGPDVAESDEELIEQVQFIASREGERGRPWSAVAWELRLTLPGGERLQATHPPITPRPHIVIRRHPLISTTLNDLVGYGSLSQGAADLLTAAVKARKSIVVSGQQGTGKTTLVRALAHAMHPLEHIVTIESERELHLDKSGLHHMVTSFESRPGQGEMVDGKRAGEVSLDELIVSSLRHNTQRIIVGEVRGPEVAAMIQAMQAGAGSMSTIHTNSPTETVERLAVLVGMSGMNANAEFAYRLIEQHVDLIVQLSNYTAGEHAGVRYVSEISEVVPGEGNRPLCHPIFRADPGSVTARIVNRPQDRTLEDLEAVGFDASRFFAGAGA